MSTVVLNEREQVSAWPALFGGCLLKNQLTAKVKTLAFWVIYWQTKQVIAAGQALQDTVGSRYREQVTRSCLPFHKERQYLSSSDTEN